MANEHVHPAMRGTINSMFHTAKLYDVTIGDGFYRVTVNDVAADSPAQAKRRAVEIITKNFKEECRLKIGEIVEVNE